MVQDRFVSPRATHQAIASLLSEKEFWSRPHISIAGKLEAPLRRRLPRQVDGSILRRIEVGPVERSSVARNLGRGSQPFGDIWDINPRHQCISIRRQEMHVWELLRADQWLTI